MIDLWSWIKFSILSPVNLDKSVTEEPLNLPDQPHQAAPLVLLLLRQASLRVHNWSASGRYVSKGNDFNLTCDNICYDAGKFCVGSDELPQYTDNLVPLDLNNTQNKL